MSAYPWTLSANRVFTGVLLSQLAITVLICFFMGEWLLPIGLSLLIVSLPLGLIRWLPHQPITRHTVAAAIQLITALHIDQTMGLVEMHFEIFAVLAFLIYYRDWKVLVTSVTVVAVHHVLFFVLQLNDVGVYIFAEGYVTLGILAIHASFAVAEGAVLAFISHKSYVEAKTAITIKSAIETIVSDKQRINLKTSIVADNPETQRFADLINTVRESIAETYDLSSTVNQNSDELTTNTRTLTGKRENSAAQIERIVSAIDEMGSTIASISDQAQQAREAANESLDTSSQAVDYTQQVNAEIVSARETIDQANQHIQSLEQKSSRINTVVTAINDITKQTNLLALNAAIEAARAGEHGRGFAVVADEVRSLAQTTERNAKEISDISQQILEEVELSVSKVSNASSKIDQSVSLSSDLKELIERVSERVASMADRIEQVAFATEQQNSATGEMSNSAQALTALSHEELQLVEANDDKARELADVAKRLKQRVSRFDV